MTDEQRARAAACECPNVTDSGHSFECHYRYLRFITVLKEARRDEREACAVYCENHQMGAAARHAQGEFAGYVAEYRPRDEMSEGRHEGMAYAAAIRARGEPQ